MATQDTDNLPKSTLIADQIRQEIVSGALTVDDRLPSEAELARRHDASRPTVREALKRLAAQSLIRTQRGATGGAFVNRLSVDQAVTQQANAHRLLISTEDVEFDEACSARFALERAALPFASQARTPDDLAALRAEIARQSTVDLSHEAFCASDVAFHRALVDATGNLILAVQISGVVESIQPLMNMITVAQRSRDTIIGFHKNLADALEAREADRADAALDALFSYTMDLFRARPIRPNAQE